MTEQNLKLIKDRQLILKNGVPSSEILLVDPDGDGDMYFTFEIRYTDNEKNGSTRLNVKDAHHAAFSIDTMPNAITRPSEPIRIGAYGAKKAPLYVSFVVQPQIGNSGEHNVLVTFYTGKEDRNGDR